MFKCRQMVVGALLSMIVSGWATRGEVTNDLGTLFGTSVLPLKSVEAGNGFDDLFPLQKVLKDVQVVGMGECTHGSREVFQMKHRMFEFLVVRMGFTVFALEASMPDTVAMDLYVTKGEGDPKAAVKKQGFWTWTTEEVRDLLVWMRKYNQNPDHTQKLRVVGIDMQNQKGAETFLKKASGSVGVKLDFRNWEGYAFLRKQEDKLKAIHESVDTMVALIEKKEGKEKAELVRRVARVYEQSITNYRQTSFRQSANSLLANSRQTMEDAAPLLKECSDLDAAGKWGLECLDRMLKPGTNPYAEDIKKMSEADGSLRKYASSHTAIAKRLEAAYNMLAYFPFAHENMDVLVGNYRDQCMAENTVWITKTYLPGQKVMLWAHNGHVANQTPYPSYRMMGSYLTESLTDSYFPVGFAFNEGSFQAMGSSVVGGPTDLRKWDVAPAKAGSLDADLDTLAKPLLFLNIESMSTDGRKWIDVASQTRSVGAVYDEAMADQFYAPQSVGQIYRGLIFIKKTTRARPL